MALLQAQVFPDLSDAVGPASAASGPHHLEYVFPAPPSEAYGVLGLRAVEEIGEIEGRVSIRASERAEKAFEGVGQGVGSGGAGIDLPASGAVVHWEDGVDRCLPFGPVLGRRHVSALEAAFGFEAQATAVDGTAEGGEVAGVPECQAAPTYVDLNIMEVY